MKHIKRVSKPRKNNHDLNILSQRASVSRHHNIFIITAATRDPSKKLFISLEGTPVSVACTAAVMKNNFQKNRPLAQT